MRIPEPALKAEHLILDTFDHYKQKYIPHTTLPLTKVKTEFLLNVVLQVSPLCSTENFIHNDSEETANKGTGNANQRNHIFSRLNYTREIQIFIMKLL